MRRRGLAQPCNFGLAVGQGRPKTADDGALLLSRPVHDLIHDAQRRYLTVQESDLTQEAAHQRLTGFLIEAHRRRLSVVLVITGKGDGSWDGRGVLKRMVPGWLKVPPVSGLVVGFAEAHAYHGGAGALYVRLRRRRP